MLLVAQNIVAILLLTHSIYFRPHRTTLLFLAITLPPSAVYDPTVYVFNRVAADAEMLDVWHGGKFPLFSLFGFYFAFYMALTLGLSLVRKPGDRDVSFGRLLGVCVIVFVVIGVCLETLNTVMKWWTLQNTAKVPFFNVFAYMGMWYWRPSLAFPVFLGLLLPDPVMRRRVFRASLIWCWVWIWDSFILKPFGGPLWDVLMMVVTFSALGYIARVYGQRVDLRIPVDEIVFDHPRWIFGRDSL